jgi:hypothetical protein
MDIKTEHTEWSKEHSLTSPDDRDKTKRWRPEQGVRELTNTEVTSAMDELNNTLFTDKFPRADKVYADPAIQLQNIGLISFTPAKGAVPNEKGIYGFAKLRGNYSTQVEADQRAEYLIRNADSYHQIYHTYVGRPFPITFSSQYSADTTEIDIRKEMTGSISSNIKKMKEADKKDIDDIKNRQEKLLNESKVAQTDNGSGEPSEQDPYEDYITQNVKRAQLSWLFSEHLQKLNDVRDIILKTRDKIKKYDIEHPEFSDNYFDKYMEARKQSGISMDKTNDNNSNNFLRFMVEDIKLPTIDTDEQLPKPPELVTIN